MRKQHAQIRLKGHRPGKCEAGSRAAISGRGALPGRAPAPSSSPKARHLFRRLTPSPSAATLDSGIGWPFVRQCWCSRYRAILWVPRCREECQIAANSDPFFASKNDPSEWSQDRRAEPHIAEQSRSWRAASGEREVMRGF